MWRVLLKLWLQPSKLTLCDVYAHTCKQSKHNVWPFFPKSSSISACSDLFCAHNLYSVLLLRHETPQHTTRVCWNGFQNNYKHPVVTYST